MIDMVVSRMRAGVCVAAAAAVILGLAGCGDGSETEEDTSTDTAVDVSKDDAIAALVPGEIAEDGVLTIGTDASYAPNQFIDADGETIIGFDVDLARALGQVLGLEVDMQNAPFASLVEGVKTGKYDLSFSSFTINPERLQQVDMVSYFNAGTAWATAPGNPRGIDPDDACGKQIAVQQATVQVADITARDEACRAANKPGITINQYQLQSDATNAVVSAKDDAMLADSPVVAFAVQQTNGQLETLGEIYDSAPYGVALPKGLGDFAEAVRAAMQSLMDSGAYNEVLEKWGVADGGIDTAEINPAL